MDTLRRDALAHVGVDHPAAFGVQAVQQVSSNVIKRSGILFFHAAIIPQPEPNRQAGG
jgi:hypothetical protein